MLYRRVIGFQILTLHPITDLGSFFSSKVFCGVCVRVCPCG